MGDLTIPERLARGEEPELVDPLDYLILAELPDEGTILGGLYPLGESVKGLGKKFPSLTSDQISGEVRSMMLWGLTKHVQSLSGSRRAKAWQRTAKGKEVYEAWLKTQK